MLWREASRREHTTWADARKAQTVGRISAPAVAHSVVVSLGASALRSPEV